MKRMLLTTLPFVAMLVFAPQASMAAAQKPSVMSEFDEDSIAVERALIRRSKLFGAGKTDSSQVRPPDAAPDLRSRCYADSPPECWTVPTEPMGTDGRRIFRTQ